MFEFKNFGRFQADLDRPLIRRWLQSVANKSEARFVSGMKNGPHSGRFYRGRNGLHRASAPGEYPANKSGKLLASRKKRVRKDEATFGTNVHYAKYLKNGTSRMIRRNMSDTALLVGAERAKPESRGWASWKRRRRLKTPQPL